VVPVSFWILEASVPQWLVAGPFDSVDSSRDGHPVLLENLQHLGNVGGAWGDLLADGGEHLCTKAPWPVSSSISPAPEP
jgi:hypothetical protein